VSGPPKSRQKEAIHFWVESDESGRVKKSWKVIRKLKKFSKILRSRVSKFHFFWHVPKTSKISRFFSKFPNKSRGSRKRPFPGFGRKSDVFEASRLPLYGKHVFREISRKQALFTFPLIWPDRALEKVTFSTRFRPSRSGHIRENTFFQKVAKKVKKVEKVKKCAVNWKSPAKNLHVPLISFCRKVVEKSQFHRWFFPEKPALSTLRQILSRNLL